MVVLSAAFCCAASGQDEIKRPCTVPRSSCTACQALPRWNPLKAIVTMPTPGGSQPRWGRPGSRSFGLTERYSHSKVRWWWRRRLLESMRPGAADRLIRPNPGAGTGCQRGKPPPACPRSARSEGLRPPLPEPEPFDGADSNPRRETPPNGSGSWEFVDLGNLGNPLGIKCRIRAGKGDTARTGHSP